MGIQPISMNFDKRIWASNSKVDGWVCQNDSDCTWIDNHFGCDDRNFTSSELKVKVMFFPILILLIQKKNTQR